MIRENLKSEGQHTKLNEADTMDDIHVCDKGQHNWLYVSLLVALFFLYSTMIGFNALQGSKPLFKYDMTTVSDTYAIEITPAGWVFAVVWSTIFFWQYVWLIYAVACLVIKAADGDYIYQSCSFIHYGMLLAFAVNNAVVIAWLFLFDRLMFGECLIVIVLSTLSLHVFLFISFYQSHLLKPIMTDLGLTKHIWLNRILVQNGVGFYVTWLSLASNLNMAIFLTYGASVNVSTSSLIALLIIFATVVTYFILENFILQRFLLHLYTPWVVLNLALIGSVAKNYKSAAPTMTNIFTVFLLVLVVIFSITKIVMVILYHKSLSHRLDRAVCNWKNDVDDIKSSTESV